MGTSCCLQKNTREVEIQTDGVRIDCLLSIQASARFVHSHPTLQNKSANCIRSNEYVSGKSIRISERDESEYQSLHAIKFDNTECDMASPKRELGPNNLNKKFLQMVQ